MLDARILLVDDDPANGRLVAEWLAAIGCTVTFAGGPAEADEALAGGSFDVVLSDIQMPGNCRMQWVERISGDDGTPPVILMTGDPTLDSAMRAANLPVAAYLLKPVNHAELQALLARLTREYRERTELRGLADHIVHLLAGAGAAPAADGDLARQFARLARAFQKSTGPGPGVAPARHSNAALRAAIADAIAVIQETKGSFRSKELGRLRARLEGLLGPSFRVSPERAGGALAARRSA